LGIRNASKEKYRTAEPQKFGFDLGNSTTPGHEELSAAEPQPNRDKTDSRDAKEEIKNK
jgi:hypothetical protein